MINKCDLHLHSKFSNKSSIWALRKVNCPESFTTPEYIYNTLSQKGMDYITITDHNTIDGVLEIADRPNTFISSEITTFFPENNCKAHVVVCNITEALFDDILKVRKNIYELIDYLRDNDVVHFLAHPLYDLNRQLSVDILEKMLLLFNVFEVKNGSRSERFNSLIEEILLKFNKEKLELLANKHNIEPYGSRSWIKGMVGGSDDHSGYFLAQAYTVTRKGRTLREFMASINNSETWAGGDNGDSLTLAHSIYGIGYRFFEERFQSKKNSYSPVSKVLTKRLFSATPQKLSLTDKIRLFIKKNFLITNNGAENASFEKILDIELINLFSNSNFVEKIHSQSVNKKIFSVTSYLVNRLLYIYTKKLTKMHSSLGLLELINSLSSIGIAHLFATPYYIGYHYQNRSRKLLSDISHEFLSPDHKDQPQKIALFTDTLHEINGVAITIKRILEAAKKRGIELIVITSTMEEACYIDGVKNFKAIGDFALPEYPELKMCFPPILDLISYFEKEKFTTIHVSTPGFMGLIGLILSRLMDVPITGTYHTDIPQYVRDLTNDFFLESAAWNYMIWFYNLMDEVTVPSLSTRDQLTQRGLEAHKVRPLPRWVNTDVFKPENRNPEIWNDFSFHEDIKFLYVGRVSREKNLELLTHAFINLIDSGKRAALVIVGDGPYREEMEEKLKGYPVLFTGYQSGTALGALYASSDVFVFPSITDTFGNVVLEAQASGLPVIVSNKGGPQELMVDGETGVIIKATEADMLLQAMISFLEDRNKIAEMGNKATHFIVQKSIKDEEAYSTIFPNLSDNKISNKNNPELVKC